MSNSFFRIVLFLFIITSAAAQVETEVAPPYNIKTVSFVQNNKNVVPIFKLGEGFQLQFDDLFGNEADYYYEITHCDYNWKPIQITPFIYLKGFTQQRFTTYRYSSIALTKYTHYQAILPDRHKVDQR